MKLKILAVVVLGAVGVGAAIYAMGGIPTSAASTTQFLTSPATTGDVANDVAATGTLAADASYGLAFGADPYLASGDAAAPNTDATWSVSEVKVAVGDSVAKGDVLATATSRDLQLQYENAKTALKSANVSLRAAKSALADAEDGGVTAQIRQAKIGLYDAETRVANAEADKASLKAQLAAGTLKAPIDGIVTAVNVTAGLDAPAGAAFVVDSSTYEITTDVVESDLADIEVGQVAAVTIGAVDADVTGKVTAISPVAGSDGGSGVVSFPVTVTLASAPATARAGMSADVTITIASASNVLTVPSAALRGRDGDYSVMVLDPATGQPTAQAVEVGLVTNTVAEIRSGLAEGQEVVTGTASAQNGTTNQTGGFGGGVAIPGVGPGGERVFRGGNGGNGNGRTFVVDGN